MKANSLSAPALRMILIASLVSLIAIGVVGFLFLRTLLITKADETSSVVSRVLNSDRELNELKNAERILNENLSVEQKVRSMVPANTSYQYQDAIALNILAIAKKAGVVIKSIDYTSGASAPAQSGTSTAPVVSLPGGISSTSANIVFESPLRYDHLLAFVNYIEVNTMRMQIANINISSNGATPDGHSLINSEGFTIGVYIRNE